MKEGTHFTDQESEEELMKNKKPMVYGQVFLLITGRMDFLIGFLI